MRKTTQTTKLVERLNELTPNSTELLVFPNRTTSTGKIINEYLKSDTLKLSDQAIHLLFSANRWEAGIPSSRN